MPALRNARRERFAQEIAKGKSAAESYNTAGYAENRHNASALARTQPIITRVEELIAETQEMAREATRVATEALSLDVAWVLSRLMKNASMALGELPDPMGSIRYDVGGANKALETLGRHLGLFKERMELSGNLKFESMSESQLESLIARLADDGPDESKSGTNEAT